MSVVPKLTLSDEELQLAGNRQWILTKRSVIDKTVMLFGQVAAQWQNSIHQWKSHLPAAVIQSLPKITRGENYLQLPYVILDYPRSFEKEDVFAIRTMFWWGNFISITLHVSGKYKDKLQQVLQNETVLKELNDEYLCINEEEWQHHFEPDNYLPVNTLTTAAIKHIISQRHFIKVAAKFTLQQWNNMPELLEKEFLKLMQLVTD